MNGPRGLRQLQVRQAGIARRVDALFKTMSTDFLLREQFVTDPAQLLNEYVHGRKLPDDQAQVTDQFIYAVMSNERLLNWFRDYAVEQNGRLPGRDQFVADFGRAVVDSGANHVVLALARASLDGKDVFGPGLTFLSVLFDAIAVDLGRVIATEMSTGHTTGTEMSTGHIFGRTGFTRPGFQRVTFAALTEHAMRLRDSGALDAVFG